MSKLKNEASICTIQQETCVVEEQTKKQLLELAAHEKKSVQLIEANNIKALAEITAKKIATEKLQGAKAYEQKKTATANMIKQAIVENAVARLSVARDKKVALTKECQKELTYSGAMQPMREHD